MKNLIFDIETAPVPDALEILSEEIQAPSNYKDVVKIDEYVSRKKEELIAKAALNPFTGFICAFGHKIENDERGVDIITAKTLADEKYLIERILMIMETDYQFVIGHNIFNFDLPYIYLRACKYGLKPLWHPLKSFNAFIPEIIDTMQLWNAGRYPKQYISLDALAKFYGVGEKKESGKNFYDIMLKDYNSALLYLENDIILTEKIYQKMV